MPRRTFWHEKRGQAAVEFALLLPVLLLILFGTIEFGRLFAASLVLGNAARDGARLAAVGADDGEVVDSVLAACLSLGEDAREQIEVDIEPADGERESGGTVTVALRYSLPLVTPVLSDLVPNPFPLTAECVMRVE